MKKLLLATFLFISMLCNAKSKEERYFITTSEAKINLSKITAINGDSVFFTYNNAVGFIHVDSIARYYYCKHGRATRGLWIGAIAGLVAGGVVGAIAYDPNAAQNELFYPTQTEMIAGFAFGGAVVGGLTGLIIGSVSKQEVKMDFKNYPKDVKKQLLFLAAKE